MKRRDFIKVTGLGVAGAATIAAPAIAQSIPEIISLLASNPGRPMGGWFRKEVNTASPSRQKPWSESPGVFHF